jgi:cytochrome c oxidase subunit 2
VTATIGSVARFADPARLLRLAWILPAAAAILIPFPVRRGPPAERIIRIEARRFGYQPAEIRVDPGDRVTIELAPMDVVHGFALDGYGVGLSADPGRPARITFIADKTGTFRFRCPVVCGDLHPFMTGKLTVGGSEWWARAAALALIAAAAAMWWTRP